MTFVTAQELQDFLNPEGLESKYLTTNQSANVVTSVLNNANSTVRGYLPEVYRRMQRTISGFVLTRSAKAGTTSFVLPESLRYVDEEESRVWVNLCGVYRDRLSQPQAEFSIETAGGDSQILTLNNPLNDGDVVVADLRYDMSKAPQILKSLALQLAAYEMMTRKNALVNDADIYQQYQDSNAIALQTLRDLSKGRIRIDEWDELDLIAETETVSPEGWGIITPGW